MKLTFNTGRQYTRSGQIVVAEYDEDKKEIRFNDTSRMIHGKFPADPLWDNQNEFARAVMRGYDGHFYKWCSDAPKYDPAVDILNVRI